MKTRQHLPGPSALQAYQADIPAGGTVSTPDDQAGILVATLLRQSLVASGETAERIRDEALKMARASLGPAALRQGCSYDDHPAESRADVIRLLAQRSDHAGRVNLAQHMLESIAAAETDSIQSGRILGDRARMSTKLGHLDLGRAQAEALVRLGRRARSAELMARGYAIMGANAETRGNRVEFHRCARLALRHAEAAGMRRLQAAGHSGLGTFAAMSGKYGDAVGHYWEAYRLSEGRGMLARTVLANLGQTLLVSGRPAEARKVATIVLTNSPPAIAALPVLGCYALASANLGDAEAVTWACTQVKQLTKSRHAMREAAEALVECAAALESIGKPSAAGVLRRRGEGLAARHGFHDLMFEEARRSARPGARRAIPFHEVAEGVATEIMEMEVPRLPNGLVAVAI